MATTPQQSFDLQSMEYGAQPTHTWWRDPDTNRIAGTADGLKAMRQAVEVILNVVRFQWPIYSPYFGMEWRGLIGQDKGYIVSELQRRMKDAFSVDPRIRGIAGFRYTVEGDTLTAEVAVSTVYGEVKQNVEVKIS